MKTINNKNCLEICNGLLRGEISAVETYDIAIEKFGPKQGVAKLSEIRSDHQKSVTRLRDNIQSMDGTPTTGSGAWGTFAGVVEKAATLFGESSAVSALIQGEKLGIHDYESALESDDLMEECRSMISEELLPKLHRNLEALEHLK